MDQMISETRVGSQQQIPSTSQLDSRAARYMPAARTALHTSENNSLALQQETFQRTQSVGISFVGSQDRHRRMIASIVSHSSSTLACFALTPSKEERHILQQITRRTSQKETTSIFAWSISIKQLLTSFRCHLAATWFLNFRPQTM